MTKIHFALKPIKMHPMIIITHKHIKTYIKTIKNNSSENHTLTCDMSFFLTKCGISPNHHFLLFKYSRQCRQNVVCHLTNIFSYSNIPVDVPKNDLKLSNYTCINVVNK